MIEAEDLLFDERLDDPMIWSVSGLKTVASCGKQWWFRYRTDVQGLQTPYLAFGKTVHRVIENMHRIKDFTEDTWQDMWSTMWTNDSEEVDFTGFYKPMFMNSGRKMIGNYAKENENVNVLELEVPFPKKRTIIQSIGSGGSIDPLDQYGSINKEVYKIGPYVIRGVIDQIRRTEGGRLLVVDLKTSKYPPDPLLLRADPQFTIYWHVARQMYPGEDPLMALYHLESGKLYYTNRTDNDVLMVEEMIAEGQKKVDLKMFARNIGNSCRYCPFINECLGDNVKNNTGSPESLSGD